MKAAFDPMWRLHKKLGRSRMGFGCLGKQMTERAEANYQRFEGKRFSKSERVTLIKEYLDFYKDVSRNSPAALNRKVSRDAFRSVLDRIGTTLVEEAGVLSQVPGPVADFLAANPLPSSMAKHLPAEIRAFCLLLNGLKQWVAAEQLATDKLLLGGNARQEIKELAAECVVSGEPLDQTCELHHPVRDGRPPIPLSKSSHAILEGQGPHHSLDAEASDAIFAPIYAIRGRKRSWANLYRGCLEAMGEAVSHSTPAVGAEARSFARKCVSATGLSPSEIAAWLHRTRKV